VVLFLSAQGVKDNELLLLAILMSDAVAVQPSWKISKIFLNELLSTFFHHTFNLKICRLSPQVKT
jgi:hypothetical protein